MYQEQTQPQSDQGTDQQTVQTQPDENQQVLNSLQNMKDDIMSKSIYVKVEGARDSAILLTAFLAVITVCRYFVWKRRMAKLARSQS